MAPAMMKAVVLHAPGDADALKIERRSVPTPGPAEVLVRVRAFGLNRSELFTRQGHSPGVALPRILGIEAVGIVEAAPGGGFVPGEVVATVMGGMGRDFDGSYAQYTCVPAKQLRRFQSTLSWEVLGALPEMLQTAWGALFKSLRLDAGEHLLIRGGTTSVGLAAATLARRAGATVSATTRNPAADGLLRRHGASHVFIDHGEVAEALRAAFPDGVDKVLELVGTSSMLDSLRCAKPLGVVCLAGIVGNQWAIDAFSPNEAIPTAVRLTTYSGSALDFTTMPFDDLLRDVADGSLAIPLGRTFAFDDIVEAHRCMEENRGGGKIVVLMSS